MESNISFVESLIAAFESCIAQPESNPLESGCDGGDG
ncbi:hypothetical protein RLEG3_28195 [Rhizobium leguminosarum bv. trifolii WSM1689]|nr:hypothetical protein RLEG3_28195 [Rhizobium leguminosarum bv. trifolii WSM1689]